MGEQGAYGRAMSAYAQVRHAEWKAENTNILVWSSIPFQSANNGESLLFREAGKPKVDFFPSTGRWREAGVKQTYRGGARAFVAWYRKAVRP